MRVVSVRDVYYVWGENQLCLQNELRQSVRLFTYSNGEISKGNSDDETNSQVRSDSNQSYKISPNGVFFYVLSIYLSYNK